MNKLVLATLLVAAPLCAQNYELGVFAGQQSFKSDVPAYDAKAKTVFGARFGYSLLDIGPALFQVTAGFQPKSETPIEGSGPALVLQHQHMSVGAMFNFKAVVAFGAGIEYRFEKLNTGTGQGDVACSRPWARANVGMAFPTPMVKPFVGLEVAMPLNNKSGDNPAPDSALAYAPKFQVGLYAGIRF